MLEVVGSVAPGAPIRTLTKSLMGQMRRKASGVRWPCLRLDSAGSQAIAASIVLQRGPGNRDQPLGGELPVTLAQDGQQPAQLGPLRLYLPFYLPSQQVCLVPQQALADLDFPAVQVCTAVPIPLHLPQIHDNGDAPQDAASTQCSSDQVQDTAPPDLAPYHHVECQRPSAENQHHSIRDGGPPHSALRPCQFARSSDNSGNGAGGNLAA